MSKFIENPNLGPRARILKLTWEDPKPKHKEKKKIQFKPKKEKKITNNHDPRTKSQDYPGAQLKPVTEKLLQEIIGLIELTAELPTIITYEVVYLDEE